MDTSGTYIKMCDYEEIQGKKAYKTLFAGSNYINIDQLGSYWAQKDVLSTNWRVIWLPRQDQLQEMVRGECDPYCGAMLSRFMDWYNENYMALPSMEQLWLAFVMKEKYNKVWDGEQWKHMK